MTAPSHRQVNERRGPGLRLIKVLLRLCIIAAILAVGLKVYFSQFDKIALRVRAQVTAQVQSHQSQFLTYSEIPVMYRKAVVATEDRSFFTNFGISFRGIARAIYVDAKNGRLIEGGSTITQQLVHNALLASEPKSLAWKLRETIYAIGLYDTMGKKETFALYANDIYFGQNAYGLYAAAETYFGRPPSQLNVGELTMLAGLPNAPSVYDPFHDMKLARQRQQLVLTNMIEDGVITQSEAKSISSEPIHLHA
ncbi:transglycosylase domain-containing protein [Alicyclobacillus sp. ALC3]|nr:transglycosylase domain-containing protein [Alicyclobacillus sp. ALC3]